MKKRFLISLIATLACVILANHYWLIFKPMEVNFDIQGAGTPEVTVFLDKKYNDDDWHKAKSETKTINLNNTRHAQYFVEHNRVTKKFKITVVKANGPVKISNLTLGKKYYKLDDLNAFKAQEGKLVLKDKCLILYPEGDKATLIYDKKLNVRTSFTFDVLLFIIIIVLAFALSYKITTYLADFKTIKNESRIDIIFLTVFFILLFIPMLHISKEKTSIQENRMLTNWRPLICNEQINYKFGKNVEDWYNDRFNGREPLLNLRKSIYNGMSSIYENNDAIFIKNDKFFIYKEQLNGTYAPLTNEELNSDADNLKRFEKFCNAHGISLYILIVPQKVNIYSEEVSKIQNLLVEPYGKRLLLKKTNIIYPIEPLLSEKQRKTDELYFKSDTHTTDYGMYIAYLELIKSIKIKYPSIKPVTLNQFNFTQNNKVNSSDELDFSNGDINIMTVNDEKYLKTIYKHYNLKNIKGLTKIEIPNTKFHEMKFHYSKGQNNVWIIGSSYVMKLSQFLRLNFRNTYRIQTNYFEQYDITFDKLYGKIQNQKPNVIVICLNEGDAHRYISKMYK